MERYFGEAIATNRRMGARPWLARAQHEFALALLRRDLPGDRAWALELLEEARRTAEELGMQKLIERGRSALPLAADAGA